MKIQEWEKPDRGPEKLVWPSLKDPLKGCGLRAVGRPSVEMAKVWDAERGFWVGRRIAERDDGAKFLHKERLRA